VIEEGKEEGEVLREMVGVGVAVGVGVFFGFVGVTVGVGEGVFEGVVVSDPLGLEPTLGVGEGEGRVTPSEIAYKMPSGSPVVMYSTPFTPRDGCA